VLKRLCEAKKGTAVFVGLLDAVVFVLLFRNFNNSVGGIFIGIAAHYLLSLFNIICFLFPDGRLPSATDA
jgi:hypothetical protein